MSLTWDDIQRAYEQIENTPPPPTEIKLTTIQYARLLASPSVRKVKDTYGPAAAGCYDWGVPVRLVDDVHDSTPYLEGWDWR